MSCCYVVPSWPGPRRAPYPVSPEYYLSSSVAYLEALSHRLDAIIVVHNEPGERVSEQAAYFSCLEGLRQRGRVGGARLIVASRPNQGASYGSYAHAYEITRGEFDYYIVCEDDYHFTLPDFDGLLVEMIERRGPDCAFLGGAVIDRGFPEHMAVSGGILRSGALERLYSTGGIPYYHGDSYTGLDSSQVGFSQAFLKHGFVLADWLEDYATIFQGLDADEFRWYGHVDRPIFLEPTLYQDRGRPACRSHWAPEQLRSFS